MYVVWRNSLWCYCRIFFPHFLTDPHWPRVDTYDVWNCECLLGQGPCHKDNSRGQYSGFGRPSISIIFWRITSSDVDTGFVTFLDSLTLTQNRHSSLNYNCFNLKGSIFWIQPTIHISHPQPISATIMASWLKTLLLFFFPFTFAAKELDTACGLKMQVLSSSSSMTTM